MRPRLAQGERELQLGEAAEIDRRETGERDLLLGDDVRDRPPRRGSEQLPNLGGDRRGRVLSLLGHGRSLSSQPGTTGTHERELDAQSAARIAAQIGTHTVRSNAID